MAAGSLTSLNATCQFCGTPFVRRLRNLGKFCSKTCNGRSKRMTLAEKYEGKVERKGPNECWDWKGAKCRGYGLMTGDNWKTTRAHRVSYILHNGPIADGLLVRHKCDNPSCTNPLHLELGTHADNARDCVVRERTPKGESVPTSKLTAAKVREIRDLSRSGINCGELGRRFSVRDTTILNIVKRRTWRHVP